MSNKKKVGPLIPLDDLKTVVKGLVAVPKPKTPRKSDRRAK
jgi:hypothetical protein